MIFMTSNLRAAEIKTLVKPRLGFQVPTAEDPSRNAQQSAGICRTGIAAARRKFTPEFINRLDKMAVFKSLGRDELRRIVDIELEILHRA